MSTGFGGDESAKPPLLIYALLFDDSLTLVIEVREPSIVDRLITENFRTDDLGVSGQILCMGQINVH